MWPSRFAAVNLDGCNRRPIGLRSVSARTRLAGDGGPGQVTLPLSALPTRTGCRLAADRVEVGDIDGDRLRAAEAAAVGQGQGGGVALAAGGGAKCSTLSRPGRLFTVLKQLKLEGAGGGRPGENDNSAAQPGGSLSSSRRRARLGVGGGVEQLVDLWTGAWSQPVSAVASCVTRLPRQAATRAARRSSGLALVRRTAST
jgi:hypothetical protein